MFDVNFLYEGYVKEDGFHIDIDNKDVYLKYKMPLIQATYQYAANSSNFREKARSLPYIFTPDKDNVNDIFIPIMNKNDKIYFLRIPTNGAFNDYLKQNGCTLDLK